MYDVHIEIFRIVTCTRDMTVDAAATFSDNRDGTCDHKEASLHSSFPLDKSGSRLIDRNDG